VWALDNVRRGRVLAPDLSGAPPDVVWDYSQDQTRSAEAFGVAAGAINIAWGFWNLAGPAPGKECAWELVGRAEKDTVWGACLAKEGERGGGLVVHLDAEGRFRIEGAPWERSANPTAAIAWTEHSAIRKGRALNTLLLVLRERRFEVYVNQRAVCPPILFDKDIRPALLQGTGYRVRERPEKKLAAGITNFAIWYRLPPPSPALVAPPAPGPTPPAWPAEELRAGKITAPNLSGLTPLADDRFSDPGSGFPRGKIEGIERDYADGKYFIRWPAGGSYRVSEHLVFKGSPTVFISRPTGGSYLCPAPARANGQDKPGRDLACRLTGKVRSAAGGWGLALSAPPGSVAPFRASVVLDEAGRLRLTTAVGNKDEVALPPIDHPAIKRDGAVNTLLVVVRGGRLLEAYVNGAAVTAPLVLERELASPWLSLVCHAADDKPADTEFRSFTVWRMDDLPPAERRRGPAR
jgi:hypothetical protein